MRSSILYFLILVLRIPLNLGLNAGYKKSRFFKTLLKKNLELVLSRGCAIVFDWSFMLLPAKIDPIAKKQSCKRDAFMARNTGYIKIILVLLTEIVTLSIKTSIV